MGDAPALETEQLSKRFVDGRRKHYAVHEVSLSVPKGSYWVIEGPSGSGKTTLLALLGAMIAPTRGDVRIDGQSVVHLRDRHRTKLRRDKVGFVFQELALIPQMSLWDNILLPFVPDGGPTHDERERLQQLLGDVGLGELKQARVERLSGGERQRACIVRALARNPSILILDEPTAHLDRKHVEGIKQLLARLKQRGHTLIATTHDPRLADDAHVDRRVRLVDGKMADCDAPTPTDAS